MADSEDIPLRVAGRSQHVRFEKSVEEGLLNETNATAEPRCSLCPEKCYSENCVAMSSVFNCLALICSIGVFCGLMATLVVPHLTALNFVPGNCTVVNASKTGEWESCACGRKHCDTYYPCIEVLVTYRLENGEVITSMIHEEEHVFSYRPHCSFQPDFCHGHGRKPHTVNYFWNNYARIGKTYPCFHSRNGEGALRVRARGVAFIVHIIFWPALCVVVFSTLCLVICCYCCEREEN